MFGFAAEGELKKVEASGGSPQILCDLPCATRRASWSPAGVIVLGLQDRGLMRVSDAGGTLSAILAEPLATEPYFP